MNDKMAVFLTGGGAKGSFQIGFFKALESFGIKPSVICGSSIGALVGGAVTYMDSYNMYECWKTLTLESVLEVDSNKIIGLDGSKRNSKLFKETFMSCMKFPLLIDIENIRKLLYNSLDGEKIKLSKVDFGITTTVLPSFKMLKIFKENMKADPLEYILASLYLPIFRPQKIIDDKNYIDIAAYRHYPLEMLKEKDCSNIYIVNVSSGKNDKLKRDIVRTNFDNNTDITIVNMENKPSLLDFSEQQALENYNQGYDVTSKILEKRLNSKNII